MSKGRGRTQRIKRRGGQASRRRRQRRVILETPEGLELELLAKPHKAKRRKAKAMAELVQDAQPALTPAQAHRLLRRNRQKRTPRLTSKTN